MSAMKAALAACCNGAHMAPSAHGQVVHKAAAETYIVAGLNGEHYVVSQESWHGERCYTVRAFGQYGPDVVTTDPTPKGAIQNLNRFHESRGWIGSV